MHGDHTAGTEKEACERLPSNTGGGRWEDSGTECKLLLASGPLFEYRSSIRFHKVQVCLAVPASVSFELSEGLLSFPELHQECIPENVRRCG